MHRSIINRRFVKKVVTIIFSVIIYSCNNTDKNIVITGLEGKPMPQFSVLALDSATQIDMARRSANKPYIIFSFAPWCPYCKAQTEELLKEAESFGDIDIYMLSVSPIHELTTYAKHYGLEKYSNITMAQDTAYRFIMYFNTSVVPYFAVFGTDNKLKQVFEGKSNIASIKKAALAASYK